MSNKEDGYMVRFPCRVGDTLYIVTKCENIITRHDNDYINGTGAVECPFESTCNFEDCDDNNFRICEVECSSIGIDRQGIHIYVDNLALDLKINYNTFLNRKDAEDELCKIMNFDNCLFNEIEDGTGIE